MEYTIRPLYEIEEKVMEVLWAADRPYVISDILKADASLKRNSVVKIVIKLDAMGYIKVACIQKTVTRYGRAYIPIVSKEDYELQKDFIAHFTSSSPLQDSVLYTLKKLFEEGLADDAFVKQAEQLTQDYKKAQD